MRKLRIVHIPQVGQEPIISVEVEDLDSAIKIADTLGYYDLMQYQENIKGDYSNATFLEEYDDELDDWVDYYSDDGKSFDELRSIKGFTLVDKSNSQWRLQIKK